MKKILKYYMKKKSFITFLAFIASLYLRFIYRTSTWIYEGEEYPKKFIKEGQPFITCFWHGRLIMLAFAWKWKKEKDFHMLISSHNDGQLISTIVQRLGIKSFAGSSSKNGTEAFRSILSFLKKGNHVGITPDGPKGPAFEPKDGLIKAAYLAQVPIVPITFSTSRKKIMKSWDKLLLPKPFSKGVILWGRPIIPPKKKRGVNLIDLKKTVKNSLQDICKEADKKAQS